MNHQSESSPSPRDANQRHEASYESAAVDPLPAESLSDAETAAERFHRGVAAKQTGPGGTETEQSLWQGGYSGKAMGGVWLSAAIGSIALVVVSLMYENLPLGIALAIAAAIWVVVGLVYAVRRLGIHYELTTQRFIHQHGILSRRTDRIEVIEIEDLSFHQGPIQRMLGIGTIDITSNDRSHPHLVMQGIADVKTVASLIDDIRRKERKQRSLHIRST